MRGVSTYHLICMHEISVMSRLPWPVSGPWSSVASYTGKQIASRARTSVWCCPKSYIRSVVFSSSWSWISRRERQGVITYTPFLNPRQLHFILTFLTSSSLLKFFPPSIPPFSSSAGGRSSRYRRTLPTSSILSSSKKLSRRLRWHHCGAILRQRPRIPLQDFSISRYWSRRVDGRVQSIIVAGTWFSYCGGCGPSSGSALSHAPCMRESSGRLGDARCRRPFCLVEVWLSCGASYNWKICLLRWWSSKGSSSRVLS